MASYLTGSSAMAAEWTLLVLAYILGGTRIYARLAHQRLHLLLSDIFLIFACVDVLALIICDTLSYRLGAMNADTQPSVSLHKISFASDYFYDVGLYLPKFSMLAFYYRLFPPTLPNLRIALKIVILYVTSCCMATIFMDTFWCGSTVSINWSLTNETCNVFTNMDLFVADWTLNITSDVLIFGLPFPLLRSLKLASRAQVYGLVVTFALGLITISVSTVRFVTLKTSNAILSVYIWSMAEYTTAIMVVSIPALRSLLRAGGRGTSAGETTPKLRAWSSRHSSRLRNGSSGRGAVHLSNLDEQNNSQAELNGVKSDGIYKAEEVVVRSDRLNPNDHSLRPATSSDTFDGHTQRLRNSVSVWV
ncbi:hypothetical protein K432DRAFT_438617 [Lepidopterella palustris CBS 459.81]|uniref:Rhodopsin domain-containing protein n=1 Tax=Lepidopterella palustris CBS 459.81 TaxID=1314670 RepID=A0A8E2EM84_9PEZI|nr:hypothetical protein K432DRAFT_438617 [Lepidopterella palustris CBS 459.81]